MTAARDAVVLAHVESPTAETLRGQYTVRTAYDAEHLADSLDAEVDVLLVNPEMGGVDVADLATHLGAAPPACQVGVLATTPTAVTADCVDVCLRAPVPDAELLEVVDWLATRAVYRRQLDRYYALARERAASTAGAKPGAEAEAPPAAATEEDVEQVQRRLDALRKQLRDTLAALDDESVFEIALADGDGERPRWPR